MSSARWLVVSCVCCFAVIKDVVDGFCIATFFEGLLCEKSGRATFPIATIDGGMLLPRAGFLYTLTNSHKTGFLEEVVDVAHLRQCFYPGQPTEFAAAADKIRCNARTAKSGMYHDTRKHEQLAIHGL